MNRNGAIIAVIPARAGSKGIPGKNLADIGGLPLVAHAIHSGLDCEQLESVIVSTDDEMMAAIARQYGAEVPFLRPATMASDEAPTWPVLQHAVNWYEMNRGPVQAVVTLQATSPFRTAVDVDNAIEKFLSESFADSLISVCKACKYHPLTLYKANHNRITTFISNEDPNTRRQDFETVYWRNGAIYITSRNFLFDENRVVSDSPLFYEMPEERSVNIDSKLDLDWARFLWKQTEHETDKLHQQDENVISPCQAMISG